MDTTQTPRKIQILTPMEFWRPHLSEVRGFLWWGPTAKDLWYFDTLTSCIKRQSFTFRSTFSLTSTSVPSSWGFPVLCFSSWHKMLCENKVAKTFNESEIDKIWFLAIQEGCRYHHIWWRSMYPWMEQLEVWGCHVDWWWILDQLLTSKKSSFVTSFNVENLATCYASYVQATLPVMKIWSHTGSIR